MRDLLILLLFNSIDESCFQFIKTRSELAEVFIKETSHTCKHISYLLRHCCAKRCFELLFSSFDGCFSVPLGWGVEWYKCLLEFHYFSYYDLHFILGVLVLALNNVVISEKFGEIFMHLNDCLCDPLRYFSNTEQIIFF